MGVAYCLGVMRGENREELKLEELEVVNKDRLGLVGRAPWPWQEMAWGGLETLGPEGRGSRLGDPPGVRDS